MATTVRVKAQVKFLRVSTTKMRQIANIIRNRPLAEARLTCQFTDSKAAKAMGKLLDSVAANAEFNDGLNPDELSIVQILVEEGPTIRRFQPRARGRAYRIRKRTSHVTVVVAPTEGA